MKNDTKLIAITCSALILIGIYCLSPIGKYLNISDIKDLLQTIPKGAVTLSALLLFFAVGSVSFISVPLMVLTVTLIFNWWQTILISSTGLILGSSLAYLVGNLLSLEFKGSKNSSSIDKIKKRLKDNVLLSVIIIRVSPLPPYSMSSYILGSLKVNFIAYIVGSLIGVMPITLLSVFMGEFVIEYILK